MNKVYAVISAIMAVLMIYLSVLCYCTEDVGAGALVVLLLITILFFSEAWAMISLIDFWENIVNELENEEEKREEKRYEKHTK